MNEPRVKEPVKKFAVLDPVPIVNRAAKMTDRRPGSKILVPGY
jgi:hypothetical protein